MNSNINDNINTVYFGFEKQPNIKNNINDENKLKKSSNIKIKCNKCNNIIEVKQRNIKHNNIK